MSFIYPHWDTDYVVLNVSLDSVTFKKYYDDPKCNKKSTKLLGRYQKTVKVIINSEIPPEEKMYHPFNMKDREDHAIMDNCIHYIDVGCAKIISEDIDINSDYNPEFWQQEYDSMAEAIRLSEKEGYHIF